MSRNGTCERCNKRKIAHRHHVVPRRFKKMLKKLFPEDFNGEKNIDLLCYDCHQGKEHGVENVIPKKNPLLPDYYRRLNRMFLNGVEITEEQLREWIIHSDAKIRRRDHYLKFERENKDADFFGQIVPAI
jgi:hypothetical protein